MTLLLNQKKEVDRKEANIERLFVKYIDSVIAHDIELGRDKNNFFIGEYEGIMREVETIRKDGGRVFVGGGNVFLLKIETGLQGDRASILHIRGMAQRTIKIQEKPQWIS